MKPFVTLKFRLLLSLTFFVLVFNVQSANSQTFCTQEGSPYIAGVQDGYRYELWNQNGQGTACITIDTGALFKGEWDGILNYLARRGRLYDKTQQHEEIGVFQAEYDCNYNPSSATGNSYLSVYGWTVDPLIEYYIIEDWRNWIPSKAPDAVLIDSIERNGSIYDIYQNTRVDKPSIVGDTTFQQYFSIRRDLRNKGTIDISAHFEKWESLGLEMGKMFEVSFVVEGYQSSGNFEFNALEINVDRTTSLPSGALKGPSQLSVFPNPSTGNVTIQLDEPVTKANIKIFDLSGKLIFSQRDINSKLFEVTNLKRGVYIVNMNTNGLNYYSKLVIN